MFYLPGIHDDAVDDTLHECLDDGCIFDMEVQNAQESATDAEVVEGEVLDGRKIPALPMNEPEDDESDGSPEDGPQDEEDMSDEFGDDYGYDDPEEY